MIKVDLITGFLGSGKTTFIHRYAEYLLKKGLRIAILENDYGAINIDRMMLKDLEGDNCDLEMVVGGNDYDCHRRRLKSKLITLGMLGYDRILVEPSGIFDPDEFMDILHEDPLDRWYQIGTILTIVDAKLNPSLTEESDYLLVSQTADAGAIVLSKSQYASPTDMQETIGHINRAFARFRTDRTLSNRDFILTKPWDKLTDRDFHAIQTAGYQLHDHIKMPVMDHSQYQSLFYMDVTGLNEQGLRETITALFQDTSCGNIIRIKGYLQISEMDASMSSKKAADSSISSWIEINATRENISIQPAPEGQAVILVIGENLDRDKIGKYWNFRFGSGHELLSENNTRK